MSVETKSSQAGSTLFAEWRMPPLRSSRVSVLESLPDARYRLSKDFEATPFRICSHNLSRATLRREPFWDVLSQLFCQFDFRIRCVSDLGDSDRWFRLSFAGIVSAGFAVALIRVDERGSQAVLQAASSWHRVQVVAHRSLKGAENLGGAEAIGRKIRVLELGRRRQSHRPEAQQRPVQLQQRMFGPVAAQLAAVEGLLETSVEQFDSPAPGIDRASAPADR